MSGAPWWSSDGVDDLDHEQDPIAMHLSARRGAGSDPGDEPDDRAGADRGDDAHDPAICGVCPICRGWATLEGRHPDVATNLALAGRHLALALRGLADVVEQAADDAAGAARPDGGATAAAGEDPGGRAGFRPIILDDDTGEPA